MRKPEKIAPAVVALQREVSDPNVSAWVAANAGSGKTHVLAQRVINLLLDDVEPQRILCLTFTKAAAANMAKRVFDALAPWTMLDDAALDQAIRERSTTAPDTRRRACARRLFARALETPGGLKVQTIHAFCTRLLHQFPFEANVAARFSVLDEAEQTQLVEELMLAVLLDGATKPTSALGRALATAMTAAADQTFREMVREAIGRRETIRQLVNSTGGVNGIGAALSRALDINSSDNRVDIEAELFSGSSFTPSEWAALAAVLAQGGKSDGDQARRFEMLSALSGCDRVEMYIEIFCTNAGSPRKSIVSKAIKDAGLIKRLCTEQDRVRALLDRRRAVACRDCTEALLTVTYEVLGRYQREKERRGLLDYDDLIDKSLDLLRDVGAAWVHYKLDLGIDHLLIDEAQDTSKKQWEIVCRLAAEFTAGAGARPVKRTIFVVGDEKQSIYSFQGAAPREFAEMRRHFERAHNNAGLKFVPRELKQSFRSGDSVLAGVDEVFRGIAASITSEDGGVPPHIPLPDAPPSIVEIWEAEQPDDRREIEGWDAPFDAGSETSPRIKVALRIARTVQRIIEAGEPVGVERRRARCGDILILVRQRGALFEAIIRALKNNNLPVAGADRLVLTEHIAVMDLMALSDAILMPQDDLALANALRSPLFGFSDEDLFAIAWDRGRSSLRAALARRANEQQKFAEAAAYLDHLTEMARLKMPFAFFAEMLGAGGARLRLLARLGGEANDAIDEFLALALEYERRQTPSLQGFLAWLRRSHAEIRRDMELARDEVRVMTVHGAKGLEAPIVILADTMTRPTGPRPPQLLQLAGGPPIWARRKEDDVGPVESARREAQREAEDEYRRLLYVAMTRAADRLIICGADGRTKRPDRCWYNLVREALAPHLVEEYEFGDKVLRYRKTVSGDRAQRTNAAIGEKTTPTRVTLPMWLKEPIPAEARRPALFSPSSIFDEQAGPIAHAAASGAERQKALQKGRLVHRLMQSLPAFPPERRSDVAERYLAETAVNIAALERREIVRKLLAILDDKNFAEIFAPGSRAEVPIVGRIARVEADPILVSGQIDRLAVAGNAVLIADYKTDRGVPCGLEEVEPYVAQLALYRAVLSRVYPEKILRAALIFTEGPSLIAVPTEAMDIVFCKINGGCALR